MKILFASFQTKGAVVFIFKAAKEVPVIMHGSIFTLAFFGHRVIMKRWHLVIYT